MILFSIKYTTRVTVKKWYGLLLPTLCRDWFMKDVTFLIFHKSQSSQQKFAKLPQEFAKKKVTLANIISPKFPVEKIWKPISAFFIVRVGGQHYTIRNETGKHIVSASINKCNAPTQKYALEIVNNNAHIFFHPVVWCSSKWKEKQRKTKTNRSSFLCLFC